MSDIHDYLDQLRREEETRRGAEAQALAALQSLGLKDDGKRLARARNRIVEEGRDPAELRMLLVGENPKEIAEQWLQDPKKREQLRKLLKADASTLEGLGAPERFTPDVGSGGGRDFAGMLRELESIPVPFIRPDITVHQSDVDTPEERTAFLQKHGTDDPLTRRLLEEALQYGGLSVEPTPFGSLSRPGRGLTWKGGQTGGPMEAAAMQGGRTLTPSQLSAIAQERAGSFRLDDPKSIQRMAARAALATTFATAAGLGVGGLVAGPAFGIGSGLASGAAAGAAAGGTASAIGSRGDWDDIWKGAAVGGVTGGLGAALPAGSGVAMNAARGAGIGGAGNALSQGLSGDGFDWTQLLAALGAGGATGAASGLGSTGNPGLDKVLKMGGDFGSSVGKSFLNPRDPLAGANAQLDQRELQREGAMQDAMTTAQAEWIARFREAQGARRQAMLEAQREWQSQLEGKRAEYAAKLQAFISERESQIAEALRAMGASEGGIGALLAERKAAQDAERAEAEQARQATIRSRDFFPSALLEQAPGTGEFATSGVLVPQSPPAVQFGAEGLPASFASYGAPQTPEFSAEGFLPSGSLPPESSPAVAPMGRGRRRPFPTLLGGLSRQPYLHVT